MYSQDDIEYALEFTQVLLEPDRRIDTFGSTSFEFHLISELMDNVNETRVREGVIHADRPTIIKPDPYTDLEFEGFGEQAEAFSQWLHENAADLSILKYGFNFRKDKVREDIIREPFNEVKDKVISRANDSANPLAAVIHGVDDAWEVCLLRFTVEMIGKSQGINVFDFKRRGLL
ncbi:MAG: hypothetical protein CMO46_08005 [Verrucomicrobiales bacterium]|jgi:hypothetical protein|nr:hypothetical protein [Verrucomicrobiales bacterium]MBV64400.1 hypothetical protein [Rickettsiales bacterium]|tara:strand:- start:458 stop:982 length:525 start_codon:yes stop_codon:yes gene_type:complete